MMRKQNLCLFVETPNSLVLPADYESHCKYYRPWIIALICGTIVVPYCSILTFISSCSCLHGKAYFKHDIIGSSVKSCMEYCGGKLMTTYEVVLDLNSLRFVVQAEDEDSAIEIATRLGMETLDPRDALKWAEAHVEEVE